MIVSFLRQLKRTIVTLRFSILSIFVTLFVTAILLLICINYFRSSDAMLFTATKLMHETSAALYDSFSDEIEKAQHDDRISATLIQQGILDPNNFPKMINYTVDLANQFYVVESAYWGDENGSSVIARYEQNDSLTSEIIDRSKSPGIKYFLNRDAEGKIIKRYTSNDLSYDPRPRPWYLAAKAAKKTIWTNVYKFKEYNYIGVTVATPVYQDNGKFRGVFGMDIRLDWLSWYVREQKISENALVFIVAREGKLIAFPKLYENQQSYDLVDIHALSIPWLSESFDIYKRTGEKDFIFKYKGKTYIANYKPIPQITQNNWMIGVVVPEDDFTAKLKMAAFMNIGIGLLVLVFAILLVSKLVTQVVRPIKKLVKQTDKIKNFELDDEGRVQSRIKEVMLISDALYSMKLGLKSFQKYVPASLVRQLIETGEDARIGGSKKTLTIFFSDIENFTSIAENEEPNQLMEHVCEYFDALSKIIITEQGTIDKYIGDSIMAFWGAPFAVDEPCQRAARSALRCMNRLNELSKLWKAEGKPLLKTRIGIHVGEAIVGNVGSSERLDYSAMGDSVNVANRLEGVNKIYGTYILVSEEIYKIIRYDFVLRKIDRLAVKGKKESGDIYELLAENKNELTFDIDTYQKEFENAFNAYQARHWSEAMVHFDHCLEIYPEDTVAPVFIKRCKKYLKHPPRHWDGVWRLVEK